MDHSELKGEPKKIPARIESWRTTKPGGVALRLGGNRFVGQGGLEGKGGGVG